MLSTSVPDGTEKLLRQMTLLRPVWREGVESKTGNVLTLNDADKLDFEHQDLPREGMICIKRQRCIR